MKTEKCSRCQGLGGYPKCPECRNQPPAKEPRKIGWLARLVRHPFFWAGAVLLTVAMLGGIGGAWGFAAGVFVTIAIRESRVPNMSNKIERKTPVDAATTRSLPAVVYVVATGGFRIAIECEYPLPLEGVCARAIERFLTMGAPPLGIVMEITECSDHADASDPRYVSTESQLRKVGRFSESNVDVEARPRCAPPQQDGF